MWEWIDGRMRCADGWVLYFMDRSSASTGSRLPYSPFIDVVVIAVVAASAIYIHFGSWPKLTSEACILSLNVGRNRRIQYGVPSMSRSVSKVPRLLVQGDCHTAQQCRSAQSLHWRNDDLRLLHPRKSVTFECQKTHFSTSQTWRAGGMQRSMPSVKKQAAPSQALAMEKARKAALESGQLPDDVGLLPDTFIMPRGKNKPSWFSDYKGRLRMERKRLYTRIRETGS